MSFAAGAPACVTATRSATSSPTISQLTGTVFAGVTSAAPATGAPTALPAGYWDVASDGEIFAFGNAGFYGSEGGTVLNRPMLGMATS